MAFWPPLLYLEPMSLAEIKNLIHQAEVNSSGSTGRVKLIAVSKVQPNDRVEAVLEEGHRVFGENRVQEAQSKWPDFKKKYQERKYQYYY